MAKTIKVPEQDVQWLSFTAEVVGDMSYEDMQTLIRWCDWQDGSLWEDMTLQEILNVYRVSAEWEDWQSWSTEDWKAAYKAWNRAVIDPGNKMKDRY